MIETGLVLIYIIITSWWAFKLSTTGLETWYQQITTPSGIPTGKRIREIWVGVYTLYGMAMIIFSRASQQSIMGIPTYYWTVLLTFALVGILGLIWTDTFFVHHKMMPSVYISALMAFAILVTAVLAYQVSTIAAVFSFIYFVWICYIARITYQAWELNP